MSILKEKRIIKNILVLLLIPLGCFSLNIIINFIINLGKYLGTFGRALYELIV